MSTVPNPSWGDDSSDRLGYDGAGRVITKRYVAYGLDGNNGYSDPESEVGFTAAYDPASNKRYERHLHAENRSHLYPALDSMNRLREYQRGTLALDSGGYDVTVSTPITLPGTNTQQTYRLDGLGNWQRTARTPVGGSETTQVRQHNHVNQITKFGGAAVAYDHGDNTGDDANQGNGNIADDGTRLYAYDAFNRLVQVKRKSDDEIIATYTYDALGRRIRKVISDGGLTGDLDNDTVDYLYDGAQCIEERDPTGGPESADAAIRQYVWGQYVDELIQQVEIDPDDSETITATYYMLSDLLYRAVALTDDSDPAEIQEAYDCDAYGNTIAYDASDGGDWFSDNARSIYDVSGRGYPLCEFIFTGRRFDPETSDATTQMYFYRARYYSPTLGRFISRDPIGYAGGMNLYGYLGGMAAGRLDPMGLQYGEEMIYWEMQQENYEPPSNREVSGRDIFLEWDQFNSQSPHLRTFGPNDRMWSSLTRDPFMEWYRVVVRAYVSAMYYHYDCMDVPPLSGSFQSRPQGALNHIQFIQGDVAGLIQGDDMSYIGTYSGKWRVMGKPRRSGRDRLLVKVRWEVYNKMGLKSATYRIFPDSWGPTPKEQRWEWTTTLILDIQNTGCITREAADDIYGGPLPYSLVPADPNSGGISPEVADEIVRGISR